MLNKHDSVPLYVQLQNIIRSEIVSGKYKEGESIPSETEMMKTYQVTRTTIRKAIANLVDEALLVKLHGKGTMVCLREMKHNIWNFSGFTDYTRKKNEVPVSRVLKKEIITLDQASYMHLVRLRGTRRETHTSWLTLDTSYVPLALFPGIEAYDFAEQSLYQLMNQRYGTYPQNATLGISPMNSTPLTKELFGYKEDVPLIRAKGSVLDESGTEVEKVEVVYGPNVEFKVVTHI
ncbi:GntR family transcriptional regulator [Paenibacillus sp. LHD-117]|uniref:GntR family transcriptional regulator n=1 Tax=Paenibacillus sp. LHD-117 TaxID=3071412 RepID=UPI0027DEF295|nr:GntR family transcriptional regulator [Paenibacillus sp. LHD-117]MDQ6423141.1 GntR family transcriptional regulator [Paenibacillus sp. LHD-117]